MLLTSGLGSVPATVAGALLLGLVFNILNFENGNGTISLSAYWQLVIRVLSSSSSSSCEPVLSAFEKLLEK